MECSNEYCCRSTIFILPFLCSPVSASNATMFDSPTKGPIVVETRVDEKEVLLQPIRIKNFEFLR